MHPTTIDVVYEGGFADKETQWLFEIAPRKNLQNPTSHYVSPQQAGSVIPAHVAFSANRTCKQVIQERPLLNYASFPVIPVFETRL